MASEEPDHARTTAVTFQMQTFDNLGGIYKEIGDLKGRRKFWSFPMSKNKNYSRRMIREFSFHK